jgi:hypothetical protein
MFSTLSKHNKFIDLLTGQRYTFFTKKDIDCSKIFYEKKIEDEKEFFISLKIAMTRY